jgi:hypothetical protein
MANLQQVAIADRRVGLQCSHASVRLCKFLELREFIGRDIGSILLREQIRIYPVPTTLAK